MFSLLWAIVARVAGPSDLYDQTQPKTVSYTTDIVAHGRWILPIERGEYPATKPPLYNWIAAPFVAALGYQSELAHRFPSIIALAGCWLAVVRLGKCLGARIGSAANDGDNIGWLAGMMLPVNYGLFKLGYLARPDMLLVLWITLGWMASTALFAAHVDDQNKLSNSKRLFLITSFWFCLALAGLTKGPAAIVLLVYAVLAARFVTGRFRSFNQLQWWWGLPVSLGIVAAWVYAVWQIDPDHVREQLWYAELYGRLTGVGPEGSHDGLWGIVKTAPHPTFYFLSRFAPWSVVVLLGIAAMFWRGAVNTQSHWRILPAGLRSWLMGAFVMICVTIGLYTFSASVRADYIAPAIPPACILAAWWMYAHSYAAPRAIQNATVVILLVATIICFTIANIAQPQAPSRDFGRFINEFANRAAVHIESEPAPVVFWRSGITHLQAMLGESVIDHTSTLDAHLERGEPFWVLGGTRKNEPATFPDWMIARNIENVMIVERERSAELPRAFGWPVQVTLYWVEPARNE